MRVFICMHIICIYQNICICTDVFFNNIFKFHAAYDATIEYVSGGRICKSAKHLNDVGIFIVAFRIGQLCYKYSASD